MRYTWDPEKRLANLRDHHLDLVDAYQVFHGSTYTFADDRIDYGEPRFVTLGLFHGRSVSLVHTETDDEIHGISFRKATKREITILFQHL